MGTATTQPNASLLLVEWGLALQPPQLQTLAKALGGELNGRVVISPLPPPIDCQPSPECDWLLAFSHHRWMLYRVGDQHILGSLTRHLLDVLPRPEFWEFGSAPILPMALRQSSPLLRWACRQLAVSTGVLFDSTTGEIESLGAPSIHPGHETPADPLPQPNLTSSTAPRSCRIRTGIEFPDSLDSKYVGPVRQSARSSNGASLPASFSRVVTDGGEVTLCGGTAVTGEEAALASRAEALERFLVSHRPASACTVSMSYNEMRGSRAIDPERLCFRHLDQSRSGAAYSADIPLLWTDAIDIDGHPVWVPAQSVWTDAQSEPRRSQFIFNTTSGAAVGSTFTEAAWFALLELAERDAFFSLWYLQRGGTDVPESEWSPELQMLAARFRFAYPEAALELTNITTPLGVPTALAIARGDGIRKPAFLCAASARLDWSRAAQAAIRDLMGPLTYSPDRKTIERSHVLNGDPRLAETPEDHRALYTTPCGATRADGLRTRSPHPWSARDIFAELHGDTVDLLDLIHLYAKSAARLGVEIALKELAPKSVQEKGMHCVRAIATEMLPIWYGYGQQRVRVTPTLREMGRFYQAREVSIADLYAELHPFS